jgi:hypothetical protein
MGESTWDKMFVATVDDFYGQQYDEKPRVYTFQNLLYELMSAVIRDNDAKKNPQMEQEGSNA